MAQFADRAAAKYDSELEATVRSWLEALSGESIGDDFEEGLRSGVILCKCGRRLPSAGRAVLTPGVLARALHAIKPGLVKFRDSKMPFVRMVRVPTQLFASSVLPAGAPLTRAGGGRRTFPAFSRVAAPLACLSTTCLGRWTCTKART